MDSAEFSPLGLFCAVLSICAGALNMASWLIANPKALRTHMLRLLGLKTILYKVFGPF